MGYELRRWLRDQLPPEATSGERLVALEIADQANEQTRRCWPSVEDLARWTGLTTGSVSVMLSRLSRRGWEFRVPLAEGKDGRPLFACAGKKTVYEVPVAGTEGRKPFERSARRPDDSSEGPTIVGPSLAVDAEDPTMVSPETQPSLALRANGSAEKTQPSLAPSPQVSSKLSSELSSTTVAVGGGYGGRAVDGPPLVALPRAAARGDDGGDFWSHLQQQAVPRGRTRAPMPQPVAGPGKHRFEDEGYGVCAHCPLPESNQIHRGAA